MSTVTKRKARVIAFYLPQFHPIPENDRWWGKGFTEWTNLAKAKPLFRGHEQPLQPGELGFYDLRVAETRAAQADLARTYGVEAFCYYHYWFGDGRRLLERPFEEVLASGEPDFPFCLCWANQTWSGIWHGEPKRTLIEQIYPGIADEEAHFRLLLRAFRDPRYLRVDGQPLFVIYEPYAIPDLAAMIDRWQVAARANGLPGLHMVLHQHDFSPSQHDAGLFAGYVMPRLRSTDHPVHWTSLRNRIKRQIHRWLGHPTVIDYGEAMDFMLAEPTPDDPLLNYPCVVPNWDNTARSGRRGLVLLDSTPDKFRKVLRAAIERISNRPAQQRLVFVKSWNEWAEGNFVEPDAKYGRAFLEVIDEETRLGRVETTVSP
ncbi:MAG: glycoside hydrolase family 99-like domain-containing protein [Burkholderiaceae bacterium]